MNDASKKELWMNQQVAKDYMDGKIPYAPKYQGEKRDPYLIDEYYKPKTFDFINTANNIKGPRMPDPLGNVLKRYQLENYFDLSDAYAVDQAMRRKKVQDAIKAAGGAGDATITYDNPGTVARESMSPLNAPARPAITRQQSSTSQLSARDLLDSQARQTRH